MTIDDADTIRALGKPMSTMLDMNYTDDDLNLVWPGAMSALQAAADMLQESGFEVPSEMVHILKRAGRWIEQAS